MHASYLRAFALSGLILAATPVSAQDEDIEDVAAAFGARASVIDISLSPSGTKVAYVSPGANSTELVNVVDLARGDGQPRAVTYHEDPASEITSCDWATEEFLVCQVSGVATTAGLLVGFTRMVSVAVDGSGIQLITADNSSRAMGLQQWGGDILALDVEDEENRILMTRQFLDEFSTGTRLASDEAGLGVETVDITNGRRREVEGADPDNAAFVADESGRVRLKVRRPRDSRGVLSGETEYFYRPLDSKRWVRLTRSLPNFRPVAVDSALNVAYGFETVNGYDALFAVALDGSDERRQVLARDDVDIDELIRIGRQRRVVGASYATEKRASEYLDEDLANLARGLQAALPGRPLVGFAGASVDEKRLIVAASSDVDPGMLYLLDRNTNELSELLPLRQSLAGRRMAPMRPVVFPAADGTGIPGYLTMPLGAEGPVKAVVLPHGGPGSRDEWGFDWLVQFFAARGFAVLQPNFRGSAGYGEAWFGRNGFQAWETAVGDVNDAGRWLVSEGIADPARLVIAGWSYGGYAALQSQVLDPTLYRAVVAIAPVTDLNSMKEQARASTNFNIVSRFVGSGPHVRAGSPAQNAERFQAPVLLFHGTRDINVDYDQSRLMAARLKDDGREVRLITYEDRDHSLDDTAARTNMLSEIDGFFNAAIGK
jgi:dipeptidyl aminopeptidase/acylaminoacyl peptidase